jgi:hypothetical protein
VYGRGRPVCGAPVVMCKPKPGPHTQVCPYTDLQTALMPKVSRPPSQTWRTFLNNHIREMVSIDFLTVPAATFRVPYVLFVLAHDCRRVVHFNVTGHPTAARTARQIIEAFPEETAPRFLPRDRDQIYDEEFRRRVVGKRDGVVMTAPHSLWQSPYFAHALDN